MSTGSLNGVVQWTDRDKPLKIFGVFAGVALYTLSVWCSPFVFSERSVWVSGFGGLTQVVTSGLLLVIFTGPNHYHTTSAL